MITVMIISVCILGLFLLLTMILSISIDFRTVIDIDKNDFVVEVMLFRRLRLLRFKIVLVDGAFYIKTLRKPYRSVEYLTNSNNKVEKVTRKESKKKDIGVLYSALTHHKLRLEQLRVYINVGGDDSLVTSMIWGGAETVATIALALSSKIIESENVSILVKPEFKSADFVADTLIKVRIGSILNTLFSIMINMHRNKKAAVNTENIQY